MNNDNWTPLDGYFDRLRNSRNPHERRSILVGRSHRAGHPVLLDTDLLFEHMHILGATGGGKTTLGLMTDAIQLIRRRDGAVVIIDGKGDDALFQTVRLEAERAGRTFKWFTNKPHRSTYIFNPFEEKIIRRLTLTDIVSFVTQALNLHHGSDYGRAWFSMAARMLLKRAVEFSMGTPTWRDPSPRNSLFPKEPIRSFRQLEPILRDLASGEEFQAARHLCFIVECLAEFDQMNLSPNHVPNATALAHAIHMPEVIRDKQVIYFYLVAATDLVSVGEIGRLALYSLLQAAMAHRDEFGETPRAYCLCDEAQTLIAQNIANVLAQARSHGLACILANQTMSQLNPPGGPDLRELVMNCMCIKQIFSARDPWLQEYISSQSGITKYFNLSYDQLPEDVLAGNIGAGLALPDMYGIPRVGVSEFTGPRVTPHEIQAFSRQDNLCLFSIDHSRGFSRTNGYFPMFVDWPMAASEYRRRRDKIAWPSVNAATLQIQPSWPMPNGETIVPTSHPELAPQPGTNKSADKLRDIRRRLLGD